MKIEAITPVHIGSGEEIIPWEYSIVGKKLGIYPVDYIVSSLANIYKGARLRNLLIALRNEVKEYGFKKSFGDFLRSERIALEPLYTLEFRTNLRGGGEYRTVKSFIKSKDRVYIPGSEIKGALRTAFIFGVILREIKKENYSLLGRIVSIVKRALQTKEWGEASSKIESLILRRGSPNDARYDLFRAIEVSDSTEAEPSGTLYVDSVNVIGASESIQEIDELLKPSRSFEVEVHIDEDSKKALSKITDNPYVELLDLEFLKESATEFYKFLLDVDRKYFDKHAYEISGDPLKEPEEALTRGDFLLRIGKHQGFLSMTLTITILMGDKGLYEKLYKGVVPKFSGGINKTRKLTSEGKALGWCRLAEES